MIALVTGGSGSGKSAFAEDLLVALGGERRMYLATMEARDAESQRRVARHRAMRADKGFETLECPRGLDVAALPQGASVLLEDLPNWVAGELFGGDIARIPPALEALMARCRDLVIVTGDVFADGIAYDETTTRYLRHLAALAQQIACRADAVVEVFFSVPVWLKGEPVCI